jgi:DNA-binding NarL/FixJ family response regulator
MPTGTQSSGLEELTPRELEVLALIAQGKANATIASALVLADRTVEAHVRSIFLKLGIKWETALDRRVTAAVQFLAFSAAASNAQHTSAGRHPC